MVCATCLDMLTFASSAIELNGLRIYLILINFVFLINFNVQRFIHKKPSQHRHESSLYFFINFRRTSSYFYYLFWALHLA